MRDKDSIVTEKAPGVSRRWIIYAVVLLVVFALGFVPMWLQKREVASQLETTQKQLGRAELKGLLTTAIVDARRGEYESARLATSDFYTRLRAEIDKGEASFYASDERQKLQAVFNERDTTITMLAQRDQASAEKLTAMYAAYQSAIGQPIATTANSTSQPANQ